MYTFPWYLTLVSTNHASSNLGQADSAIHLSNNWALDFFSLAIRTLIGHLEVTCHPTIKRFRAKILPA